MGVYYVALARPDTLKGGTNYVNIREKEDPLVFINDGCVVSKTRS